MALYNASAIRAVVRTMIHNIGPSSVRDAALDTAILQAIRVLNQNSPAVLNGNLTGTGSQYYNLTEDLTGWVTGVSVVQGVLYPAPSPSATAEPEVVPAPTYSVVRIGTSDYLKLADSPFNSGSEAAVAFTGKWTVIDVDGATSTNLDDNHKNALEFKVAELICRQLAATYAGHTVEHIPAESIDFDQMPVRYMDAANSFKMQYDEILGLNDNAVVAVMSRFSYPVGARNGRRYLTH